MEDLSNIVFIGEKNESLKKLIINTLAEGSDKDKMISKINSEYNNIVKEINQNSNIQIIARNKSDQEIFNLLDEFIQDHKDQSNLKKIEFEEKLINNLDENSYSEQLSLKVN